MMKKTLTCVAVCSMVAGLAQGATYVGVVSGDWSDGASWNQTGSVPEDDATSKINIASGVTITATATQSANNLAVGDSSGTEGTLAVDGGALTFNSTGWSGIGYNASGQMSVLNGGAATFTGRLDLGVVGLNASLTERHNLLTVDNSGTVTLLNNLRMGPGFSSPADDSSSALITIGNGSTISVDGRLQWGTIDAGTKNIDISGTGQLILNGNRIGDVNSWISDGYISGTGVAGTYDSGQNKTIVAIVPEPTTLGLVGIFSVGLLFRRRLSTK